MQISRLGNGQAETNIHGQSDPTLIQGFNGRQGNLGSGGVVASIFHDDDGSGTSTNGVAGKGILISCQLGELIRPLEGRLFDLSKGCTGQHQDMTLQDIYNKDGDFDSEDDSDWEPLERQLENHITIVKWFCINCTMVNFGDTIYCHICGEHKESGILRHGFLASPLQQADSIQNIPLKRNGESK
ncbi:histone deacetylase 15, partial [Tanacetum coccineum]